MSNMFEFSKIILEKVSFDRYLFRKELIKAFKYLKPEEKLLLKVWCIAVFGYSYREIIIEAWNASINLL